VFWGVQLPVFGWLGAALAGATILSTSMIYAQMKTVPRWRHWTTPGVFLTAALAGGALVCGLATLAAVLFVALAVVLVLHWHLGDARFATSGTTSETATGLGRIGKVRLLAPPQTGTNYLLREMVHVVGRRHAARLRLIALVGGALVPAVVLGMMPVGHLGALVVVALHLAGMFAARWLFFAEAEHVVGLYYGRKPA